MVRFLDCSFPTCHCSPRRSGFLSQCVRAIVLAETKELKWSAWFRGHVLALSGYLSKRRCSAFAILIRNVVVVVVWTLRRASGQERGLVKILSYIKKTK